MKLDQALGPPRMLLTGRPGSGKTHFAGSLAHIAPTLLITANQPGLQTLASMNVDHNLEVEFLEDWGKIWSIYNLIIKGAATYKFLVVDDFSVMQAVKRYQIESRPRSSNERKLAGSASPQDRTNLEELIQKQRLQGERGLNDWRLWDELSQGTANFCRDILRIPYQFQVWTLWENVRAEPTTSETRIFAWLQGAFRDIIAGHFTLVAEADNQVVDNRLYWYINAFSSPHNQNNDRYFGGTLWENPDALKVLSYIAGKEVRELTAIEKTIRDTISKQQPLARDTRRRREET